MVNLRYNRAMKLTYETGTATFVQFGVLSILNIATGLNSIVTTCHQTKPDCVGNTLVSLIFYILIVVWFGAVSTLGYMAQEKRSKRLAQILICAELLIAMVAFFNAHHHTDVLGLATSALDLMLAAWIIFLSFRLMRSRGGRIVAKQRTRKRKSANTSA